MPIRKKFISAIKKERDITSGNITMNIIGLAFPLMIGAVLQTTQNLVDIFWVGKLGPIAITAVAMSGTVIMFVFTLSLSLGIGTLSLIAKSIGAMKKEDASHIVTQSVFLGVILSMLTAVVGFYFSDKFLSLMGASADVVEIGANYLRVLLVGSVTMIVLFICNYTLQAAGDAYHPMLYLGLANLINIILDPIFIFGIGVPEMGVTGAALATVISQAVSMILVINLLIRKESKVKILYHDFRIKLKTIYEILKIGIPYSGQMFLRTVMYVTLMSFVAYFGMEAVAAYGIVMRLHTVMLMPALALGGAAATFMGQNVGACKPERARLSVWTATWIDFAIMFLLGIIFFSFPRQILSVFNQDAQLLSTGTDFLKITAFFYSFMAFGIVLNRGLSGAGDTFVPMLITLFSLWVYLIPAAYYFSRFTDLGIKGIWWAVATSYFVHGLLTIAWFETGMWRRQGPIHCNLPQASES